MKYLSTAAALLLLEAAGVSAFWRMQCGSPLLIDRIDPLVQPGVAPAKHVHNIMGGNAFDKSTSFETLQTSTCTSCQVKGDKSIYWVPSLYFETPDKKLHLVPQKDGMLVYYIPEYGGDKVEMFPEGFAMLAGNPNLRELKDEKSGSEEWNRQMAIGFNCLNYDAPPEAFAMHRGFPDQDKLKTCKDGLRADITFPSCWNGENDSEDHKSHMAYPAGIEGPGDCPSSHPRRLITIKFETLFDVSKFFGKEGRYVWSTGDLTGYGYHGDFVNGWNSELLRTAYGDKSCVPEKRNEDGSGGEINDCQTFVNQNQLQDIWDMNKCKIKPTLTGQTYEGPFPQIPGCAALGTDTAAFECGEEGEVDTVAVVANAVADQVDDVIDDVVEEVAEKIVPTSTSSSAPPPPPPTTVSTTTKAKTTKAAVPTTTSKPEPEPSMAPMAVANPVIVNPPPKKVKEVVVTVVETVFQTVYHDVVNTATAYVPAPPTYRHRHRHRRSNWRI